MPTGIEMKLYANVERSRVALERIAEALERANEPIVQLRTWGAGGSGTPEAEPGLFDVTLTTRVSARDSDAAEEVVRSMFSPEGWTYTSPIGSDAVFTVQLVQTSAMPARSGT